MAFWKQRFKIEFSLWKAGYAQNSVNCENPFSVLAYWVIKSVLPSRAEGWQA